MYANRPWAPLLVLLFGCAGTNTGNPTTQPPSFRLDGDDTFLILDAKVDDCSAQRSADASKLVPGRDVLNRLGDSTAEFVVTMQREVSLESYPLPSDRQNLSEDNALYRARATELTRSQGCTLQALAKAGGNYVHSFLLINAFVAELTVEQAVAISELADVRSVELAQTDQPPPSL